MLYLESSLKEEPNLTFASMLSTPEEAVNLKSKARHLPPFLSDVWLYDWQVINLISLLDLTKLWLVDLWVVFNSARPLAEQTCLFDWFIFFHH